MHVLACQLSNQFDLLPFSCFSTPFVTLLPRQPSAHLGLIDGCFCEDCKVWQSLNLANAAAVM